MITLDEAILYAEEVAEKNEKDAKERFNTFPLTGQQKYCLKCADEHRQLAAWLKDYKRLLECEEKQKIDDEIKVGDEVICGGTNSIKVVMEIAEDYFHQKRYICFGKTGVSTEYDTIYKPSKTGRHFPQIEEILKQMQEDKND